MIRILIVEDQVILRESLSAALDTRPDMQVVAGIGNAELALAAVRAHDVDVVLMDVCTEHDANGISATRAIKRDFPQVKVVIMTGMPEITFIDQAKSAGADSFVYKNVGTAELAAIITSTAEGYSTFPHAHASMLSGAAKLSDTEIAILRCVCEGKSRKEIACDLYMSEGTVKRRISEILAKTGYDSILRLAVHAVASGLIVPQLAPDEPAGPESPAVS